MLRFVLVVLILSMLFFHDIPWPNLTAFSQVQPERYFVLVFTFQTDGYWTSNWAVKITITDMVAWRLTDSCGLCGSWPDETYSVELTEVLASWEIDTFVVLTTVRKLDPRKQRDSVLWRAFPTGFNFFNTHVLCSKRNKLNTHWTSERKKYDENFGDCSVDKYWEGREIGGKRNVWLWDRKMNSRNRKRKNEIVNTSHKKADGFILRKLAKTDYLLLWERLCSKITRNSSCFS